jgi:hypothetical protein
MVAAGAAIASAAIALAVALTRRRACPFCGDRALKFVNGLKAVRLVDGIRTGDSWSYYLCVACKRRLKLHRASWSDPTEDEWTQHCARHLRQP